MRNMKKVISSLVVAISLLTFAAVSFAQELDAKTQQALIDAINDEYKAKATYQKVIDKFGAVRPFSNIINAEQHHIEELLPLFQKYGVAVPKDDWYAKVPEFATIQAACEAGVQAEIENAGMYDEFFKFVQEKDIIDVFTNLRNASQEKHLKAFQRCAGRSGQGRGQQQGQGRGRNMGKGQGRNLS
jgi:hypothetical protein